MTKRLLFALVQTDVVNKVRLLIVAVTISIVILAVIIAVSLSYNNSNNNIPTPTSTPLATPTPTESTSIPTASPTINVIYHTTVVDHVVDETPSNSGNITPANGYYFLLVNVTILNNGYSSYHLDLPTMGFRASDGEVYSHILQYNYYQPYIIDIPNGGNFTGSFVIQPPTGVSMTGITFMRPAYNYVITKV
jgi:hypothetical protein